MLDVRNTKYLHDACKKCMSCNRTKQDKMIDGQLVYRQGEFAIPCVGIPRDWEEFLKNEAIEPEAWDALGPDERTNLVELFDVALWAKNNLNIEKGGWIARGASEENVKRYKLPEEAAYYQWLMLNCTATRKVFRIGRRSGKTEALAVRAIHAALTHDDHRIILVCPYQSQVQLVFKRIKELCDQSSKYQHSVKRVVATPYPTMELWNGSEIIGFTSGSRSGGNANTLRGQGAHMIILDEADYLHPDDLGSILGILADNSNIQLWASSTPTGKRDRFYAMNHTESFHQFHYPSMCNPNWNLQMELELKEQFTDVEYTHEVLADWGIEAAGVFQKQFLDRALRNYHYDDTHPEKGWVYTIGCDWNPVAGTQVVVVGARQEIDELGQRVTKFRVVDAGVVDLEGWTELKAIGEIVRLNRKWEPFAIYIDHGGGGSLAVEMLHNVGAEAIRQGFKTGDAFLLHIVKAINFGSKVSTFDPWTKEESERPTKVFMVNNAVRQFENDKIELSTHDGVLKNQIEAYIIDRINPSGIPVYAPRDPKIGDHRLDGLLLALFSFIMEKTELGRPTYSQGIAYVERAQPFEEEFLDEHEKIARVEAQREFLKAQAELRKNKGLAPDRTHHLDRQVGQSANSPVANGELKQWASVVYDPGLLYDKPTRVEEPDRRIRGSFFSGKKRPHRRSLI